MKTEESWMQIIHQFAEPSLAMSGPLTVEVLDLDLNQTCTSGVLTENVWLQCMPVQFRDAGICISLQIYFSRSENLRLRFIT